MHRVPLHEERDAVDPDKTTEVYVTNLLVHRYAREMHAAHRDPAFGRIADLRSVATTTGQTEEEVFPPKGHRKRVGDRTQVVAIVRLRVTVASR